MSDGQITNGQRAAHTPDGINAHARLSARQERGMSEEHFFFDFDRDTEPGTDHARLADLPRDLHHYAGRCRLNLDDALTTARRDYEGRAYRAADERFRHEPGALAPAAAPAHAVLTEHAMTGTSRHLPGAMPAAATQSHSRPLTHHRSRGHYSRPGKQPGFSWKGKQLWQIPPSPNGYRISLPSARHASSSPRPRTQPAPGNSQ